MYLTTEGMPRGSKGGERGEREEGRVGNSLFILRGKAEGKRGEEGERNLKKDRVKDGRPVRASKNNTERGKKI